MEKEIIEDLVSFFYEIENYQSNHYGNYNRMNLINAYDKLSNEIKKYIVPSKKRLIGLWRGCDGLSETLTISFTSNKGYAGTFGTYNIPFKELKTYKGLIDTEKVLKLSNTLAKYKDMPTIGDDEGEVIVLNPIWKETLDIKQYFV